MNYIDLFSGIGGFALGAYWAGWRFDRHYFSEIDPWCCRLYQKRFPYAVPIGDIKAVYFIRHANRTWELQPQGFIGNERRWFGDASEEWILSGGFPCQDISVAGKGSGITGARSGLWFEYARLIGEIRPRYAIMENVGALTRRGLDRVLGSLAEVGYDAEWSDIRASDVGAPHRRERIWIVAYPGGDRRDSCDRLEGRYERGERAGELPPWSSGEAFTGDWKSEPRVGRVASGVLQRVDRLKGLGNAIVPQIAELIFRQLKANLSL